MKCQLWFISLVVKLWSMPVRLTKILHYEFMTPLAGFCITKKLTGGQIENVSLAVKVVYLVSVSTSTQSKTFKIAN